ncbi:MAG: DUF4838 domain-containing protein [Kiritimatiellae bacterium]|nr:DUF4838 domain-containing protein [Kiritimatiellia bacterium]
MRKSNQIDLFMDIKVATGVIVAAMCAAMQCFAASERIADDRSGAAAFKIGDVTGVVYAESFLKTGNAKGDRPHIWGYSAAKDLAKALSLVSGHEVGLCSEEKASANLRAGVQVYVGDTQAAKGEGLDASRLMRGEFRIVTKPGKAYILSNTGMGATYGVAEFLQRYADYWFCLVSGDDPYEVAPERKVPVIDFTAKHAMYVRNFNLWGRKYARTCATSGAEFTRRLRCRTWFPELEPALRVSRLPNPRSLYPNHTFFAYCPPEKYAKDHPEYFSMNAEGRRMFKANSGSELCLTNPEVFEVVWESLCAMIEKDRADFGADAPCVYDFSQMDNADFICLCPECRNVAAKYDRRGGHKDGGDAGLVLEFVNRLARRAGEKYPGVVIRTFAYVSSDVPPKGGIVPEPNVIIWYCDLYSKCDDMLPLTHPFNSRSLGLLREWRALTGNIEVWDYYLSRGTWVAVDAMAADIRLFRDLGITRMGPELSFDRQPFQELNMFVASQLYFNPDQDVDMLVSKWCRVYGKGAAKMKRAIDFLRAIIRDNPPKDFACWHNGVWPWRSAENMEKFCSLVKDAYVEEAEGGKCRARMAAPIADVSKWLMRQYKVTPGCETAYRRVRGEYRKFALEDLSFAYVDKSEAERDRADVDKTLELMDLEFHDLPQELASVPRSELHFVDWRNMYVPKSRSEMVTNGVPEGGVAYRWRPPEPKAPPFNCSMLDEDLQTNHLHPFTPVADGKWHWYRIAVDRLGRGGWVGMPYIGDNTISFRVQHLYVECDGMESDPNWYEMWVSCKYGGDVADPEKGLFVDRLVLRRRERQ